MDQRLVDYLATLGATPESLDGWTVHTAQRAGEDVGFFMHKGPEVHMLSIVGKRAMSRRNIALYVCPILEEFGIVTTRVPLGETDHKLRLALGFVHTWSDNLYSYWALTHCPFEKKQPEGKSTCQSL